MNKIFITILCIFFCLRSMAQTYNPSIHVVTNDAIGPAQATPVDSRTMFWDNSNFIYRDYQSTTEVNTYLNLSKYRTGHFPIYVHLGGTLNGNGTYSGGITQVWFYKDGLTNGDLVRWYTDSTSTSGFLLAANNLSDLQNITTAKTNLSLQNVDNTSDAAKNAATVTLTNHTISGLSNTLTNIGNSSLVNSSIGLAITSNAGADISITTTPAALGTSLGINFPSSSATQRGPLTSADWSSFHLKIDSVHISGDSLYNCSNGTCIFQSMVGTGGSGTVTSFSAGSLSPLFTTNVATATTTPALTFSLTNAGAHTVFGDSTGSTGAPFYFVPNSTTLNTWFGGAIQGALTLTTTGSSGAATLIGNTLNIPNYTGGGGGTDSGIAVLNGILASRSGTGPTVFLQVDSANYATRARVQKGIDSLGAIKQPTGNYITATTGDVVATGPGSVPATIQPNVVTYGKMATNTANTLLGYDNSGNAANITVNNGLSVVSSVNGLGEPLGQSGNPAKLVSSREIPMNLKSLTFIDTLNTGTVKNYVSIFDSTQQAHAAYLKMIDNTGGATFQIWQPNNYGVQYNSPYWPTPGHMKAGLWSSGYASQASLDSMPDNVFQIFGYNEKFNSALRDTFDVGFRVAFENNFINNVGGVGLNAEYHDPAITIYGGHEYRINSYYMNKLNGITLQDKTVDNVLYFTAEDNTHALDTAYLEIFGMPAPQSSGHIVFLGHNGNNYNAGDITFQSGSFNTKINSFGTGDLDIQSNASRTPEQDFTRTGSVYLNQNSDAANSSGTTVIGNIQSGTVTPNASAQLEIYSSSRGLWMFPMTTTQMNAISSPANGLIVENRDTLLLGAGNGLCLYDSVNGVWRKIAGGGGGGGGSQTLQQVLTTGSTLTTNNTITNTSQTLSFTGGTYKFNGIPTSSGTPTILVHQTDSSLQQVGIGSGLSISSGNLIVSGGTSPPFSDGSALFKNASDNTKLLAFDLSAIATGTTTTWQFPNSNGMAAAVNLAQNWTQDQTYVNVALTLNGSSGNNIVLFQHSAVNVGVLGTEATNGGSESDMVLQTYGNHNLDFNVNAATRARINGAGNLMVGTTTDNSAFIQAAASTSSNASLYVPEGTAPSSPINGQMFAQTSDHNLYWQSQSSSICLSCTSNGIYLPTISNKNNLASSTSDSAVWSKNGNTVTVSGHVNLTSTGVSTSTQAYITLPINSLLSGGHACWGSGTNLGIGGGGAATTDAIITSDASTPNKAVITYVSGTASAVDIYYTLQYRIQ